MQAAGAALRWWRHAVLAGAAAGLLAAPSLAAPNGWLPCGIALVAATMVLLTRPGGRGAAAGTLVAAALVAALLGLGAGDARVRAIDAGALHGRVGERVELTAFVAAPPDRSFGEVRILLDGAAGKVMAVAHEPIEDVPVGAEVDAVGVLAEPDGFRESQLARLGVALELEVRRMRATGASRGGLAGIVDGIRSRAERSLGVGMGPEQAALARGFVLGQDERIDPATAESFRRAGLAHLLAVSGQNVMLLAILCGFVLAPTGLSLRWRLVLTIAAICVYVPVTGAGPSIQRAGVMGAAAIVATLAGRPADRSYAPLLAAVITLLLNPRAGGDVGWQLSFVAVVGIALWAGPLRLLIRERLGARIPGRVAAPLADGIAVTLAATAATAPLIAAGFERLSLTSVAANALVLPAVAPVMWLGMAIAMLGQLPASPPALLGSLEGSLIDYVVSVATALGTPRWAEVTTPALAPGELVGLYAALATAVAVVIAALGRRRRLGLHPRRRHAILAVALAAGLTMVAWSFRGARADELPPGTLAVTELDVGQGDATLLRPPRGGPVLVDAGPPGSGLADRLREHGVERLALVLVTHDELDHAGGLQELLASFPIGAVAVGRPAPAIAAAARASGTRMLTVAEGSEVDRGRLRIDVIWPPRAHVDRPTVEANDDSIVLVARFGDWDVLLTGDAEQEATHLDPGPVDVLKVAHHGSDDAGLDALLDRSIPRVALVGVGAGNAYGHPTAATTDSLAEHGVCTLRTDLDGDATVLLGRDGLAIETAMGSAATRPGCEPGTGG